MHCFIAGVFIARGKEDALVTLNLIPGNTVYGEKKVAVDVCDVKVFFWIRIQVYKGKIFL